MSSHPIISTTDADAAQSVVSRELTGSRIQRIKNGKNFRFDMNGERFGDTFVAWNSYQADIDIESGWVDDTIGFIVGRQSPVFRMDDEAVACTRSTAAVVSRSQMSVQRPKGSSIFVLKTTYPAIERRFREITGRPPKGRITFDRRVSLTNGPGALAKQTLMHVASQLETDAAIVTNELLRVALDDLLLATLLSLPHSHIDKLFDDIGDVPPGIVRRAEEFMEAHSTEPVKMRDVIEACGCSASLLNRAFQKHRGCTPSEFLASQRLEDARRRLLSPEQNDTVTSIALECGFAHLGRFAARYKQEFGESPSETLRKNRWF